MSFNHQWHPYEVAQHWPVGSVVLLRIKMKMNAHHDFTYVLINNWNPESQFWNKEGHAFQLVEEPHTKEKNERN